jgi:hypothetical protein
VTPIAQIRTYLEQLSLGEVLTQELHPAESLNNDVGLLPLAAQVIRASHDRDLVIELLTPLLDEPLEPDPLAESLLHLGVCVAKGRHLDEIAGAFSASLASYRVQFAASHALVGVSDALTDLALARAQSLVQPYSAPGETPADGHTLWIRRLRDARTARFDSFRARLYNLSESGLEYQEVGLELSEDGTGLLHDLDPASLRLRLVFESRFVELTSADLSLFDVEVNLLEQRLYFKLRPTERLRWDELESIVIMGGSKP